MNTPQQKTSQPEPISLRELAELETNRRIARRLAQVNEDEIKTCDCGVEMVKSWQTWSCPDCGAIYFEVR
jgi:rubrerythrin